VIGRSQQGVLRVWKLGVVSELTQAEFGLEVEQTGLGLQDVVEAQTPREGLLYL